MNNKYKIGDSFTSVRIELDADMGVTCQTIEHHKILGISEHLLCLDNSIFETLAIDKTYKLCHRQPDVVNIGESKSDFDIKYFGKFKISIASQMSLKHIENKINREFKKWLNEKIGVYGAAKDITIKLEVS